jgi:putative PIN family toxin of toxin-antitoxin system
LALEAQGKIDHSQLKALLAGIASVVSTSRVVRIRRRLQICRDPKDNMLIECCLAAKASVLITGDKDLLSVEDLPFQLMIVSPRNFVESF